MSFTDKVVIVTGASAGIGAGTAVAYAKQGAKLALGGRNEEKLKKTATLCEEQGVLKDDILLVLGDLNDEDICTSLVDQTIEKFDRLDVVVNNAGSYIGGNMETSALTDLDMMFNNHVRSVFTIIKRAVPHLKKSKGNIVNISSVVAKKVVDSILVYSIAKAAQNQLTKCVAQELGPSGVRVNCIIPGYVPTDLIKQGQDMYSDVQRNEIMSQLAALRRCGEVKEIADVIVFVSSDAASSMTGAEISADGGIR